MSYKAKDADRLNDQNEKFRHDREVQLKREIEQATQEPSSAGKKKAPERKENRKPSLSFSGTTASGVEEGAAVPSICPATPLDSLVSDCQWRGGEGEGERGEGGV